MCSETIYIAGRYNKYLRNLSQSPWFNDDVKIKNSVQELIEEGLKEYIRFDNSVFSSSGREDVDVRMLGNGRPFVFKLTNPFNPLSYTEETMYKIEQYVNSKHQGKILIRDLQIVDKEAVAKNIKDGQESKTKEYRALCCCSKILSDDDLNKISQVKELEIDQKTPIRVLHRRTQMTRQRKILSLRAERVKLGEFGSAHEGNIDKLIALNLVTEAGTYIKEFVHGDFGRTVPCLGDLIGEVDTDLLELDVMGVYTDWPPQVTRTQVTEMTGAPQSDENPEPKQMEDKMNDTNLSELYIEAIGALRKAEAAPRGDNRQSLYMKSRHLFEKSKSLVEELSLFSSNESQEDLTTTDLKYLLIDFYLSKIFVSGQQCSESCKRLDTLARAKCHAKDFLRRASHYGLVSKDIEMAIAAAEDDSRGTISLAVLGGNASLEAAMETRNRKIEKYKKMKVLEGRLEELSKRVESGQGDCDEETTREYYMSLIKKSIEECFDSLMNEIEPALHFERNRPQLESDTRDQKQLPPKPANQLQKPLTIVKDELQKQVFGLGYPSASTVTVDQFIDQKIKSGELAFEAHKEVYGNSLQKYAEKPNLLREQEEQSDAEHDDKEDRDEPAELERKRRWDEYKDENPRGSGNRHNMG